MSVLAAKSATGSPSVDHGEHARLRRVEDQIVEAEVAVDQRRAPLRRQVCGQPVDQPVHRRDRLGLRCSVLLRPARHLAGEVVLRPAEAVEAGGRPVETVDGGDDPAHRGVDRRAFGRREIRQRRVPEAAPVDMVPDVEHGADDGLVVAEHIRPGDRHRAALKRPEHTELAVDGVRRRQQHAVRFLAQHQPAAVGEGRQQRRVRLAAAEARQRHSPVAAVDFLLQEGGEAVAVDAPSGRKRFGPGKAGGVHGAIPSVAAQAYFASSSRPIWLRCTSSGPSAKRSLRAWA